MAQDDHRVWHKFQSAQKRDFTPDEKRKPIKTIPPWAFDHHKHPCMSVDTIHASCIKAGKINSNLYKTIKPTDGHSQLLGETLQFKEKAATKNQFNVFGSKTFPPPPFRGLETIGRDVIQARPNFKNISIVFSPHFEVTSSGSHRIFLDIMGGVGDILFDDVGNTKRVAVSQFIRLASTSIEVNNPGNHTLSTTYSGLNFKGDLMPSNPGEQLFRNAEYVEFILHIHATSGVNYINPTLGSHDYVVTHN